MKKGISSILIAALLISQIGCASKGDEGLISLEESGQTCWSNDSIVNASDTGYYIGHQNSIYYLDQESKETTSLSKKKEVSALANTVRYYAGHLYYIRQKDETTYSIFKADKDGANEQEINELFTVAGTDGAAVHLEIHKGYAYYAVDLARSDEKLNCDFILYRMKLEKGAKAEKVYELEDKSNVTVHYMNQIAGIEKQIFYVDCVYKEDNSMTCSLMSYDTETGTLKAIVGQMANRSYAVIQNDIYYYAMKENKYELRKYSMDSSKDECVKESIKEDHFGILSSDGTYLYSSALDSDVSAKNGYQYLWVMDQKGNDVDKINLTKNKIGFVDFGDEKYLFLENKNGEVITYDKAQIGTSSSELVKLPLSE